MLTVPMSHLIPARGSLALNQEGAVEDSGAAKLGQLSVLAMLAFVSLSIFLL